jgi:helix-turn-helix protein
MAKSKPKPEDRPMGSVLTENLIRLGYADTVVRTTEVARLVTEKTGHKMSRQRIANLLNAINVRPETIAIIAKALGVKPSELTKGK